MRYRLFRIGLSWHILAAITTTILVVPVLSLDYPDAFSQTINNKSTDDEQQSVVSIPRGAGNPSPDLTLQSTGNWYEPKKLTIPQGTTVTWRNDDTEPHSVTSGTGGGLISVQTGAKGKPDGIFDSGLFGAGKSWSHKFDSPGTFSYFCTIHPWMEGVVTVKPASSTINIPNYPVDGQGNKQDVWPVHTFSKDGTYDIDLSWDPKVIRTGEPVAFIADFFDARTNARLQIAPYDFIVIQDGKEVDNVHSLTQIGTGVQKYEFSKAGPITIRIANVGDSKESYSEFTTTVYPNANATSSSGGGVGRGADNNSTVTRLEGGSQPVSRLINSLTLVYFTYGVIFALPAAAATVIVLYKKGVI